MKVQLNTQNHVDLELGDEVEIISNGFNYWETEDPEFEVIRHINFALTEGVGIIPTADNTLEHLSTGKDLVDSEPELKNEGESVRGVVVSKEGLSKTVPGEKGPYGIRYGIEYPKIYGIEVVN